MIEITIILAFCLICLLCIDHRAATQNKILKASIAEESAAREVLYSHLGSIHSEIVLIRRIQSETRDLILGGQRPPTANDGQ